MATLAPGSYFGTGTSNTSSDDDFDYDLTADEEDAFAHLIASAPSQDPQPPPATSISSREADASSSLEAGINTAFSARASVESLAYQGVNLNVANHDGGSSFDGQPGTLSVVAKGDRVLEPSIVSRDILSTSSSRGPEPRSAPGPSTGGNIRYPDLSSALANVLDTPPATDSKARQERAPIRDDEVESPLSRFRTFPKKPFSVSDLTSGAWCELQYYYTLTRLPGGRRTRTAAMKGGSKLHKQLEDEVHTTVTVDIAKKEDAFGLKLWNIIQGLRTLRDTGMTRELEVWGVVDGNVVNGVIDGLTYENPDPEFEEEIRSSQGSRSSSLPQGQRKITDLLGPDDEKSPRIYLFDVKTRGSSTLPTGAAVRPTKIQLCLYHRFLANMASGKLDFPYVFARYGLSLDEPFSDTFIAQIGALHDEIFHDAESEPSSPPGLGSTPSPPASDFIQYNTLRGLLPLLQSELRLTFPKGVDSLGTVVKVEYRRRARNPAEPVPDYVNGEGSEDDTAADGDVIGENVFYVDDAVLDQYLAKDMEWWRGAREPRGVVIEEAYKCRTCEFVGACDWRRDQEAELLKIASARRGKRKA